MLEQRYPVVREPVQAAGDADAIARGRRLADITGCTDCHGADLRGKLFADDGWLHGRYYASNLTLKAKIWSDEELARIVRRGVRPDGHGVIVMPACGFVRLTDAEIADILAYVRSLPAGGSEQPDHWFGPLDQWDLWRGHGPRPPSPTSLPNAPSNQPTPGPSTGCAASPSIVCAECHSGDNGQRLGFRRAGPGRGAILWARRIHASLADRDRCGRQRARAHVAGGAGPAMHLSDDKDRHAALVPAGTGAASALAHDRIPQ
jgi:mono/diheme cytochrome c family protein